MNWTPDKVLQLAKAYNDENARWERIGKIMGTTAYAAESAYHRHVARHKRGASAGPRLEKRSTGLNSMELESNGQIQTLEELLEAAEVDLDIWKVDSWTANKWEVATKDNVTGEVTVTPLWQVKAKLIRIEAVVPLTTIHNVHVTIPKSAGLDKHLEYDEYSRALIIPDTHFGFRRNMVTGKLDPFHDENALDVVLQIAERYFFDRVIHLGDVLDNPDWSEKFLRSPELYFTTQPAIIRAAEWLGQIRQALPEADIDVLEGNHDERIPRLFSANLISAAGLRPVDDLDGPALFSLPKLLDFKALGINYHDGYPNNVIWLNDRLRIIHGSIARAQPGATSQGLLDTISATTIFGHIHRIESATKTVHEKKGKRHISATSVGCLCRIDGVVPAANAEQQWQQGFAVVYYKQDGGPFAIEPHMIFAGKTIYEGQLIEARK